MTPAVMLGAWVDDAFDRIDATYAAKFRACGLHEAALMCNKMNGYASDPGWELRAKPDRIVRAARALQAEDLAIILTCWPRPNRQQLVSLERDMTVLIREINPIAIEVDVEANWSPTHLAGFKSMTQASTELIVVLRRIAQHRRVELTTYPFHAENSKTARLAAHVDLLLPQAYSVSDRNQAAVPWGGAYGPGRMQTTTMARARQTGAKETALRGMGLAAYEQRFAGHTPDEAMRIAFDAALAEGVDRVRFWSSKWIIGSQANKQPWAEKFIRARSAAQ